jgi:hypothetical protein
LIYNAFEPYGYFYRITFPFALGGFLLLLRKQAAHFDPRTGIFLGWPMACVIFGIVQPVNINRINVLFLAVLICIAVAIQWLAGYSRLLLPLAVSALLVAFGFFTADYHGKTYQQVADFKFHAELLPAVRFASGATQGPVCVTDRIDMPYIYILFAEKPAPDSYLRTIEYADVTGATRNVRSMLRYTFGKGNCTPTSQTVYLLRFDDGQPKTGGKYDTKDFGDFTVYTPKR